jgi:DNA-binding NtrC family response regulator
MPLDLQTKLLRVLETGRMVRVGGSEEIAVDVRVLTASNHAPETIVRDRRLREDLYYRLAVFVVRLPPLRQRADDIELLARLFLERLNREYGTRKEFAPGALALARTHSWPGNVRELKNCVERSFVLGDDVITLDLQPAPAIADDGSCVRIPIGTTLAETERAVLLATLRHCGGSKRRTAEMLGVSVKTIYNKVVGLHEESLPASAASREAPVRIGVPCLPTPNNGHSVLSL